MRFPSTEWLEAYCDLLNSDCGFREAIQWMEATIRLEVNSDVMEVEVASGRVRPSRMHRKGAFIIIRGPREVWEKIRSGIPGGIHRAFRHHTLSFGGDMIEAMRSWKAIWMMGELMAKVPLKEAD